MFLQSGVIHIGSQNPGSDAIRRLPAQVLLGAREFGHVAITPEVNGSVALDP
jgi:hypothetical protein